MAGCRPLTPQAVERRAALAAAQPARARSASDFSITGSVHHLRDPRPLRRLHERVPHLSDARARRHPNGEDPRYARHPARRATARVAAIQQYLGDSRGRWEGDTLVVETTNFHPPATPWAAIPRYSDENLRLTERFTRVDDDTLRYDIHRRRSHRLDRPWTAAIYWKKSEAARSTSTPATKGTTA